MAEKKAGRKKGSLNKEKRKSNIDFKPTISQVGANPIDIAEYVSLSDAAIRNMIKAQSLVLEKITLLYMLEKTGIDVEKLIESKFKIIKK